MFTPLILVCVMNTCFGVSGNAYPTKELCEVDMRSNGVAFVQNNIPNGRIAQMRCIDWGLDA